MEQIQNALEGMEDRTFVFGSLFVAANRLETLLDRAFAPYGITSKQWLLLITIQSLFREPPTITQAASAMGTSHQNVKQVARNLERSGFLKLEKDARDARTTRLIPTEACHAFAEDTRQAGEQFMREAFDGVSDDEAHGARNTLLTLWQNTLKM
ncbi:MAG: MarR family transcriptional regulator [Eubacteriales bacterium]|nr:MarR family transcriptional regulator [Eubacteriales bacterium]